MLHRSEKWHAVFIHAASFSRFLKIENAVSPPLLHFFGDRGRERALTEHEDIFYKRSYWHNDIYRVIGFGDSIWPTQARALAPTLVERIEDTRDRACTRTIPEGRRHG